MKSKQQELIDIMFQIGLTIHQYQSFQKMTKEEVAEWIAEQLRICGFDTEPMGASWAILKNERR